jgi:arginase
LVAIQVLGFPTTLGLPRRARRHAPEALRDAGLLTRLKQIAGPVTDLGDLVLPAGDRTLPVSEQVRLTVAAAEAQAAVWERRHRPGDLMFTIGGDHTTSLGTMLALTRMGYSYDVIWIDAHGDCNIIETSPSGNTHGMVLALATGLMPDYLPGAVAPSDLRLWGVRDLDPGERRLLREHAVEVLSPDQVRGEWKRLVARLKPHVLLSFDIDSVDPHEAPGTMVPVPDGFTRNEALELVALIARNRHLLALDIVEFHPDYDHANLTLDLACQVAVTAVTEQVERTELSAAAD